MKTYPPRARVYLDWASAAPVSKTAEKAFTKALASFGNPSSPHAEGLAARQILEDARTKIARLAGIKSEGVIFTSGATEANNLAIQGVVKVLRVGGNDKQVIGKQEKKTHDAHVLYLPTAHASVVETMEALRDEGVEGMGAVEVEALKIKDGAIDLAALREQLRPDTVLISMDLICGETGTRWATRDVRRVLDAYQKEQNKEQKKDVQKILLHVDASQAPFVESINCNQLGADLLTLDAQKVGGVRGIGALLRTSPHVKLSPSMYGGGQEQGLRPGTENPALAAAFAAALVEIQNPKAREEFIARAAGAREALLNSLESAFASRTTTPLEPPAFLLNAGKEFSPHILNISFPGIDTDYAVMLLSEAGFAVSTKSACETNEEGSRVISVLFDEHTQEPSNQESSRAISTLRISWGPTTTTKELRAFARELISVIHFLDTSHV